MPTSAPLDAVVQEAIATHGQLEGPLLPVLHAVQHRLGHVPDAAVPLIAQALNLSIAEVHGVVTYYHHFRREPAGRRVVQVCRAEACQAMGADGLWEHARQCLGVAEPARGHGVTTADGAHTLEPVYCLGLCAQSPAVMVNDRPHARMTPARLDRLLAREAA